MARPPDPKLTMNMRWILGTLRGGPMTRYQIDEELPCGDLRDDDRYFNAAVASVLARMVRRGLIIRHPDGTYSLPD
jgi:hypothetical protein